MKFAFDLWAYDDVTAHAGAILERLRGRIHALRRRLAQRSNRSLPTVGRHRQRA